MEITVAAANGLLRRARSTMKQSYREPQTIPAADHQVRSMLRRYVEAWETGDVATLIALLSEKVVFSMPPSPTWYSGLADVRIHALRMFSGQVERRWRLQPTHANHQPAFACYRFSELDGLYHAHSLHVLVLADAHISEIHAFFLPHVFPHFGLTLALTP
jgi:RNA polymerase sigma-70 factor (ECF subfamily)